jgi:Uncharacterized conserved protein
MASNSSKKEQWDLFFISFLTLDRVKHFMWRYQDPNDPTYPGPNPFERSIKDFYVLFDTIIGEYRAIAGQDTRIMGHQRPRAPEAVLSYCQYE